MTLKYKHTLLLVDDEESITKSLQRVFRKSGYHLLTAQSGAEGLELLKQNGKTVSLIISDQRMPGMNGAQFLDLSKQFVPDAVRFLLTGYSDMDAIVDAVNKGEIHRYLTKPWNDDDLCLQVRSGLEQYELVLENRRLLALTAKQNKELSALNKGLEEKVQARTLEIQEKNRKLEAANKMLEESFLGTIRLLSTMVERLNPTLGAYLSDVTQLVREVAEAGGMTGEVLERIEIAAMIHDIGLLGLPARIALRDELSMSSQDFALYSQHPLTGQICLQAVERLNDVGRIVLHHHERLDGSGFPKGLKGEDIPRGSRILGPVADYCRILHVWPKEPNEIIARARKIFGSSAKSFLVDDPETLLRQVAKRILVLHSNTKYDLDVVSALVKILGERDNADAAKRKTYARVGLDELQEGMILGKSLYTHDDRMLLNKGTELKQRAIDSIRELGRRGFIRDKVVVEA